MNEKLAFYLSLGIGALGALGALSAGGGLITLFGALFAGIGAALAMAFYKYGYMLVPWLTQRSKTVLITTDGYEIPPTQDVIVKKSGDGKYYASVFLGLRLYQSAVEMSEEQIRSYNKLFERAMASFKKVVKIGYVLHAVDITEKRKELETKKAEAQLRLQREREKTEPDPLRIERFEREVMYWNAQIDKLTRGLRPLRVVLYAMTTDAGLTRDEAIARANNNASELRTLLSNALNTEVVKLTADEMLKVFDWERFMPVSPEDLEERTEREKTAGGGI
ncbi:MAG: hypothetical protein D6769_03525 [Methanobacteriota archaeon]|nr:MAG: hypothetical protein D6769_03525 [Euryarchaeota archaeon]